MLQHPRSHRIEDLSRNRLRDAFNSVGWIVGALREDYGEYLLVRIFEQSVATPLAFFVQAKGTDRIEDYTNADETSVLFPTEKRRTQH
jgi:hypothetical protein